MTRILASFAILSAIVPAAASAATYAAKPVAAPAAKRIIARDIAWTCGPSACRGVTESSRPLLLCQGLAKQAGRLESFAVDGRALPVADLEKCGQGRRAGARPRQLICHASGGTQPFAREPGRSPARPAIFFCTCEGGG